MASERRRYLAAGMDLCLTKPVAWGELLAALAGIAAGDGEGLDAGEEGEDEPPLLDGVAAGPRDARLAGLLGGRWPRRSGAARGCGRCRRARPSWRKRRTGSRARPACTGSRG